MMGRIGFRRLLPILFVLIHAALLLASTGQHVTPPDVGGYPPISDMPPPPLTVVHKAALVLNLPALILSIPLVLSFPRSSDAGSLSRLFHLFHLSGTALESGLTEWSDMSRSLVGYVENGGACSRPSLRL
jgi:hypothetical protein